MQLERLIAALAPTDVVGDSALEIRELAYDAREVPRDSLFFCVPGAKADGHDFAAEALEGTRFAVLVFTNLAQDHLDFHGTMEEYFDSRGRLLALSDLAFVNV